MAKRLLIRAIACVGLSLMALAAHGGQQASANNYEIHYSAVSTRFLTPEVAHAYGLQRSAGLGLINVSVREKQDDGTTRPVNAGVKGSVGTLDDAPGALNFRTVRDNGAVYQLATFRLQHDTPMHFTLKVRADRNAEPERITFIQRFYLER
ncbi:MAG: DUF4426 domain-containing protein [Halomonas sp.]|nr:DUF4426 domain-containing protein [Halomonas sp.]MDN6297786.1 DUF4426 domain-containing protein [Halomonas sp.]MDN6314893.1 DUF4426 domain-containing protein [Halomonas sp.]MDN6336265.1 DUF4426 domain-containing protein [Halomonas sp.]